MPWALTALATILRIIPHPFNLTPVGAVGLFAGANCNWRTALVVPIVALLVGDLFGGFYDPIVMAGVYVGILAGPVCGAWLLRERRSSLRYVLAVWLSSTGFFLLSNFGMWVAGGYYARTYEGLVQCYLAGLPFYGRTLIANAAFTALLFGTQRLFKLAYRVSAPQRH